MPEIKDLRTHCHSIWNLMLVSHIHIDLVGPLPQSKVFSYILTCIDQFTHWADAIPLTNVTVQSAAEAFVSIWISRFGVPSTITTDRGSQFKSSLWKHLHAMELLGSSHIRNYVPPRIIRCPMDSLKDFTATSRLLYWHNRIQLIGLIASPWSF